MDNLEHFGIKGMKWGVRKAVTTTGKKAKEPGRIKKEFNSMTREMSMSKSLKKIDSMTNEEIKSKTNRMRLENDFQRLAPDNSLNPLRRKHVRVREDRNYSNYLDRSKMSDSEIKSKVERLQLEDNMKQQIKNANKDKKAMANKIIKTSSDQLLKVVGDNFSPTKNDTANIVIREALKFAKQGKALR